MSLPTDAKARKQIPIHSGFLKYFPDAIAAVAQLSQVANEQHNPGEPLHWAKEKSQDELDAQARHILDEIDENSPDRDEDGVLHATKNAWRALAHLQRMSDSGVELLADTQRGDYTPIPAAEDCLLTGDIEVSGQRLTPADPAYFDGL